MIGLIVARSKNNVIGKKWSNSMENQRRTEAVQRIDNRKCCYYGQKII